MALGIIGSILLVLSLPSAIYKGALFFDEGYTPYVSTAYGIITGLMAITSFILTLAKKNKALWWTGGISLFMLFLAISGADRSIELEAPFLVVVGCILLFLSAAQKKKEQ